MLDVPSQSQGETMGPTSWPLECMVWACADQGKKMVTTAREELLKQQSLHVGVKRHGQNCFVMSCLIKVLRCMCKVLCILPVPPLGCYCNLDVLAE